MGIENLDEYKKRKAFRKKREAKYLNRKSEWLLAVYNPKNFRRNTKSAIPKENKSNNENKVLVYILAVGFGFFLIIMIATFR
jgi:hypothetical protein